jgi:chromosome segregation ATPase
MTFSFSPVGFSGKHHRRQLSRWLAVLSEQIESVLETSSHLQAEHAEAQSAISDLVSKVSALEALKQAMQGQMQAQ